MQPGERPAPSSRRSRRRINRTLDAFSSCSCNVAALPDLLPSVTSQRVHFCSALLAPHPGALDTSARIRGLSARGRAFSAFGGEQDLSLPRQLRRLDNYDFLLLDDLGYLPQGAEESEVLFTLIAERYERRSLGITSNLVFSQWEHIFANPMATAAAIDRVVHHSVILEFDVPSYRTGVAQQRGQKKEVNRQE